MKYPAILKNTIGGQTVLAVSGKLFIHMSGKFEVEDSESYSFDSRYKNITREYLSNTWGVVESKEHAEFIIELAELHGFKLSGDSGRIGSFFSFSFNGFGFLDFEFIARHDSKQITIPLPPKDKEWPPRREEFPKQVIATGKIFNLDSDDLYRWVSDCGKMEVIRPLESLKCEGDFAIMNHESNSDELPKVGDDVEAKHDSGQVLRGELLAITNEYAIIQQVGHEQHLYLSAWALSKPKTPEQELREDLIGEINSAPNGDYAVDVILEKYNITKKGECDE